MFARGRMTSAVLRNCCADGCRCPEMKNRTGSPSMMPSPQERTSVFAVSHEVTRNTENAHGKTYRVLCSTRRCSVWMAALFVVFVRGFQIDEACFFAVLPNPFLPLACSAAYCASWYAHFIAYFSGAHISFGRSCCYQSAMFSA